MKRHTALIKRIRQSLGIENRDQILKDIESLSLEKYVDEICGAAVEGMLKCKNEKDVWSAVEVRTHLFLPNISAVVPLIIRLMTFRSRSCQRFIVDFQTPSPQDSSLDSQQRLLHPPSPTFRLFPPNKEKRKIQIALPDKGLFSEFVPNWLWSVSSKMVQKGVVESG